MIVPVAAHKVVAEEGGVHEMLATTTRLADGWRLVVMYGGQP
ncbi:hypothetical protein OG948_36785 (plasmid) [Embleya sp. NBC_00888]|nr:hypothetical protein OG948_36785 [Embleya sp. NBC_00888]